MSLGPFPIVLIPSTKNGVLQFYNDLTGEILEAAFSRPDVGATSGASVFDKDGNLIELAENEPDWSFPIGGGCPRIQMRPQSQNLCSAPRDISTASKVNVTIPDATTIREDGSAASEFFAFQDFSGFSSSTDYTMIIEVEPVGGRNFRLQEDLGSSAITNIDFVAETASGSATLIKQGNGRFLVFLPITTGASQTSIRFLMRVLDGSLNTSFDGDVNKGVNITLRDIQAGHEGISPIPNNVTRSSNQYTLDLSSYLSENVVSFYVEASFGVTQQDLFRFGDGGNSNLVAIGIDNQKLRGRYRIAGGSYSSTGVGSATVPLNQIVKIAGVISPAGLKLSFGGAIDLNAPFDLSSFPLISALKSGAIFDTLFPHEIKTIALNAVELNDDQLNAATA